MRSHVVEAGMFWQMSHFSLERRTGAVSVFFTLAFCILALAVTSVNAQETKVIRYHATEWEGLTNKDGTGLYHEILNAVFKRNGFRIDITYFPFRRTILNVSMGEADIAGATVVTEPHVLTARHPIWESRISVLFHKQKLANWNGIETLASGTTVSPPTFSSIVKVELHEVATRDQALNMLLTGRMEYFVDEHETLSNLKSGKKNVMGFEGWRPPSGVEDFDWDLYVIRDVISQPLYMVFEDSERGHALRHIYDTEIEKLHQSGELAKIYEKWGLLSKTPKSLTETQ